MKTTRLCNHWQGMPFSERAKLPAESGIYAAKIGTDIVYVGRSVNIRNRWKRHTRHDEFVNLNKEHGLEVLWQLHPPESLASIEAKLIKKIQPVMNGDYGTFKSEQVPFLHITAQLRSGGCYLDQLTPYSPIEKFVISWLLDRARSADRNQNALDAWESFDDESLSKHNITTPIERAAVRQSLAILERENTIVSTPNGMHAIAHLINGQVA
jgi:hypothetical protein